MSVTSMKLPSVTISSDLKWDYHINHILKLVNTTLSLLNKLKIVLNPISWEFTFHFYAQSLTIPVWLGIRMFPIDCLIGWRAVLRKRSRIIFNEVKVLYISFCRKANQVILNERRTKFSLHFANNVFHNLPKNSLFPSQFFFLRPCLPRSVSTKILLLPPMKFSAQRYRRTFIPSIRNNIK